MLQTIKQLSERFDQTQPTTYTEDYAACEIMTQELADDIMLACSDAYRKGRAGWHRGNECTIEHLVDLFDAAVHEGNLVKIATYAAMLNARGIKNPKTDALKIELSGLSDAIVRLTQAHGELGRLQSELEDDFGSEWQIYNNAMAQVGRTIAKKDARRLKILNMLG